MSPSAHQHTGATGVVFLDARGAGRALRVTWHEEAGVVVLSMWRENVCVGSFRLGLDEVPELVATLVDGLAGCCESSRRELTGA